MLKQLPKKHDESLKLNLIEALKEGITKVPTNDKSNKTSQYLNSEKFIAKFLQGKGFSLKEKDFEECDGLLDVDTNGLPYYSYSVKINPFGLIVEGVAIHNSNWTYYIDAVFES